MFLKLDFQSEVPIYTQLVQQVIEGIAKKQLNPGDPLPSVRSLASDVGINLHTVNKAYNELKQGGYVQVHRKSGVIISPDIPPANDEYHIMLNKMLRPLIAEAVCKGLTEKDFLAQCSSIFNEFKT